MRLEDNEGEIVFFSIMFLVLGFCLSQLIGPIDFEKDAPALSIPISEAEIVERCGDLDITSTSICLKKNIKTFYKYTRTSDDIASNMTLDDIKKNGTDCGGYSALYSRLIEEIGFNYTFRGYHMKMGIFPGHKFVVMWDDETYCKLDMLDRSCRPLHAQKKN